MSGAFTKKTRDLILLRDGCKCFICGIPITVQGYSIHHRRARGMGGSKDPAVRSAANGITLCGSGTTGCHGMVEADPEKAREKGWRLFKSQNPATVQVWSDYRHQWCRLDDAGGMVTQYDDVPF